MKRLHHRDWNLSLEDAVSPDSCETQSPWVISSPEQLEPC